MSSHPQPSSPSLSPRRRGNMSSLSTLLVLVLCLFCCLDTLSITENSHVHIVYLGETQHDNPEVIVDSHHDMLVTVVGSKELASKSIIYNYKHGFSGFAAKLTESEAKILAELPEVVRVIPSRIHNLQTGRSWDYLGLSPHSTSNILLNSSMGDGVIIGVLDSGIWPESESFNEKGLGKIPPNWKGVCEYGDTSNATIHCNRKIIGARWFISGFLAEYGPLFEPEFMGPRDVHGHGTQTASTAAGSCVHSVSFKGLGSGTIRGGAPKARLAIYKVCWNPGKCSSADILRAMDEAIHDGVHVFVRVN